MNNQRKMEKHAHRLREPSTAKDTPIIINSTIAAISCDGHNDRNTDTNYLISSSFESLALDEDIQSLSIVKSEKVDTGEIGQQTRTVVSIKQSVYVGPTRI